VSAADCRRPGRPRLRALDDAVKRRQPSLTRCGAIAGAEDKADRWTAETGEVYARARPGLHDPARGNGFAIWSIEPQNEAATSRRQGHEKGSGEHQDQSPATAAGPKVRCLRIVCDIAARPNRHIGGEQSSKVALAQKARVRQRGQRTARSAGER